MNTSRTLTRLTGIAIAAVLLLPGAAHAAALTPIKACYAAAVEPIQFGGSGFTPSGLVDIAVDGALVRTVQADPAGNLPAQTLPAPAQVKGQRAFNLTATDQANPANTAAAGSNSTAFGVSIKPATAPPSKKVRFRGRGFTQPGAVYGHYLFGGKVRKTVRFSKRPAGPCGTFSVKRRQIPIKQPRLGQWTLQLDQQKKYRRAPERLIKVIIRVQRVFKR